MKSLFLSAALLFSSSLLADDAAIYSTFLNNIKTMEGNFTQKSESGHITGKMKMSRPGKLRLDYNPPSKLLVVADGKWLITYDKELDETNYISLDKTPAEFILRDSITFDKDLHVVSLIRRHDDTTAITLERKESPEDGQITMVFSESPILLKEWEIVDAQGQKTKVVLSDMVLNQPISDGNFKFRQPNVIEQVF